MSNSVYIFLDESGNLDFSPTGTRYFVLASVSMERPFQMNADMDSLKYDCLDWGLEQEYFHCSNDNAHVRKRVFDLIGGRLDGVVIDSLLVEKRKTGPALTSERRFYPEMLGFLLKYVLNRPQYKRAEEIIIITDTVPLQKKRKVIEKSIKTTLAKTLPHGLKYRILHHSSRSHYGLQVADYCSWSIFRKHEVGDSAYFDRISPALHSDFDIFRNGTTYYY